MALQKKKTSTNFDISIIEQSVSHLFIEVLFYMIIEILIKK